MGLHFHRELKSLAIQSAADSVLGEMDDDFVELLADQEKAKASPLIESAEELLDDTPCIAYLSQLKKLASLVVTDICLSCGADIMRQSDKVGSALFIEWV